MQNIWVLYAVAMCSNTNVPKPFIIQPQQPHPPPTIKIFGKLLDHTRQKIHFYSMLRGLCTCMPVYNTLSHKNMRVLQLNNSTPLKTRPRAKEAIFSLWAISVVI